MTQGIPNIYYEEDKPLSPPQTEMEIGSTFRSQLNVIITEFKLDKQFLQKDFSCKENKKNRIACFKNYSKEEQVNLELNTWLITKKLRNIFLSFID